MPYLWVPPAATKGRLLVADGTSWQPLTVGSDDQVLTADSAESTGVKWAAAGGGGGGGGLTHAHATRTSGNITLNGSSWTDVDTGMDLTIACSEGDVVELSVNGLWNNESPTGFLEVATIVSSAVVNYVGEASDPGSGNSIRGWQGTGSAYTNIGSPIRYTIQAGDISSGNVTFRLRGRTSVSGNKILIATSSGAFRFAVVNLDR